MPFPDFAGGHPLGILAICLLLIIASLANTNSASAATEGQTWTFEYSGEIVTWTPPARGLYRIEAWGAEGGKGSHSYSGSGGKGARMRGECVLDINAVLKLLVGQKGQTGSPGGGGGGGGTFVILDNLGDSTLMVIAGGGGAGDRYTVGSASGGGGGYSGGGGGRYQAGGGGGGSYNVLSNQSNSGGIQIGDGKVTITLLEIRDEAVFAKETFNIVGNPSSGVQAIYTRANLAADEAAGAKKWAADTYDVVSQLKTDIKTSIENISTPPVITKIQGEGGRTATTNQIIIRSKRAGSL